MNNSSYAVIFDCDGVLVATEEIKYKCISKVLKRRGAAFDEQHYLQIVGYCGSYIIPLLRSWFPTCNLDDLFIECEHEYQTAREEGVPLIHRNVALAKEFHARGFKLALCSSDNRTNIDKNLALAHLSDLFSFIVSGIDDLPPGTSKPNPAIYKKALDYLVIPPEKALVFEDTPAGATAAYRAGALVFAVPSSATEALSFENISHFHTLSDTPLDEIYNLLPSPWKK